MKNYCFHIIFSVFLLIFLTNNALATTWFEISGKQNGDDNVYSYVTPYYDNYTALDFKANHKNKLRRTTHYALNYSLNTTMYSELVEKNNTSHRIGLNFEEDVSENMVAMLNTNANIFSYSNTTNARTAVSNDMYDYIHMTVAAALRLYIFTYDFTSLDFGAEYSLYTLPKFNYETDGFAPSVNFLEEIAEYNGIGGYLTAKQSLPYSLDLELTGKLTNQYCPERPLHETPRWYDSGNNSWNGTFSSDYRNDLNTNITLKLSRRFTKGTYASLAVCSDGLDSNANTTIWDPSSNAYILADDYYKRNQLCLSLDGMYVFGPESSYIWAYVGYKRVGYPDRRAQDDTGAFYPDTRLDTEYKVTVEFNQRLGYLWKTSWLLKLGYQYVQNESNDYYYKFKREIITLGLSSFLYL
jgi:hypothetical protein